MSRLFVSQERLDSWISENTVQLIDNVMTMEGGRKLKLIPAVFIEAVIGAERDPNNLVGRVKTHDQLKELSAEHYMDSLLLGEMGYQVQTGFVGEPIKE
jgi:hypothetical protein